VIGCAIDVHKVLGPGYEDAVYAAALGMELEAQGVKFKPGHTIAVRYKERAIGEVRADLFVEERFIVEVMARPGAVGTFERLALRAQLKAADLELGLIINFAERRLKDGLVRVVNVDKFNHDRGMSHEEHEEEGAGGAPGNFHDFEQR